MLFMQATSPPSWTFLFGGIGLVTFIVAVLYWNWKTGSDKGGATAITNWKAAYESEVALNIQITREKIAAEADLAIKASELRDCDEFRSEVSLFLVMVVRRCAVNFTVRRSSSGRLGACRLAY